MYKGFIIGGVSLVSLVVVIIACIYWSYSFDKNCGDYLKLTGDAPNVERADMFLGKALDYIEREGLTQGNSGIIFRPPADDIGIWYEQIKGAKETTEKLLEKEKSSPGSVSQLDKDNALMKIREVLLDDSSGGTSVTEPTWISWYPNQGMIAGWWIVSIVGFIIGVVGLRFSGL